MIILGTVGKQSSGGRTCRGCDVGQAHGGSLPWRSASVCQPVVLVGLRAEPLPSPNGTSCTTRCYACLRGALACLYSANHNIIPGSRSRPIPIRAQVEYLTDLARTFDGRPNWEQQLAGNTATQA